MTIHYHGLPLTPGRVLEEKMHGKHFCISFATRSLMQDEIATRHAQSLMLDNGAFTAFTKGKQVDYKKLYSWVETKLAHPNWAVIPDVIDGPEEKQIELIKQWPFPKELSAPVWHVALSHDWLLYLCDNYPKVCLGSSGQYWKVGSLDWQRRMDETFDFLHQKRTNIPWLHGLRMMSQTGKRWPFASVDSANVARNYNTGKKRCPKEMAEEIDSVNGPLFWDYSDTPLFK